MNRPRIYLLVAILALPAYVTVQTRWLREFAANPLRKQKRVEMEEKFSTLDTFLEEEKMIDRQLEEASRQLSIDSQAGLVDPRDPLSWINLKIHALAQESALHTGGVTEKGVPQLRIPRGATPRLFQPFCAQMELTGTLQQMTRFLEQMESANPYLRIREFYVGPSTAQDGIRQGHLQMDWPIRADAAEDQRARSGMQ